MRHLDLFSGIGGFALAAQWCWGDAHEVVAFCEQDEWCRKVLNKHWPDVPIIEDIFDVKEKTQVDLITGGFPCQPFSTSGEGLGDRDDRALWPEMLRVIQLFKPAWVIAENVCGIVTNNDGVAFRNVLSDMEVSGYDVQPFDIPAVACGADHLRHRIWFIAHASGLRQSKQGKRVKPLNQAANSFGEADSFVDVFQRGSVPYVCGRHHGVSASMDRLRGLGNAIVPQVAQRIMESIKKVEENA